MKKLLGFGLGIIVGLLVALAIVYNITPVAADSSSAASSDGYPATITTDGSGVSTSSDSIDVNSLLPDVKKGYNVALGAPYRQVESEITDPDIAGYFRAYMDATGLDKAGLDH
jgi:hypothetical protein